MAQGQVAVLGPLASDVATRAFLACEVVDGVPQPDRPLVVVWLADAVVLDPQRMAQLHRETALVTDLRHPNLARVYGLEQFEEGWARLVQYIDGEPLRRIAERLREEREALDPRLLGRLVSDVCSGVHYAHQHGVALAAGQPIVHGGLRPDTILVSFSGATLVTGYGASALANAIHPESSGSLDKRHYFAPEQILGGKAAAGVVTDVYGVGAVLYELLTGRAPYRGSSDLEQAVLTGDLSVPMLNAKADALMNVALRALSRRGSDRFSSVLELDEALQDALQPDGLASEHEVARLLERLLPPTHTRSRQARQMLLDFATDPDTATILSLSRDLPAIPGLETMPPFPSQRPSTAAPSGLADTVPSPSAYDAPAAAGSSPPASESPLPVPSEVPSEAPPTAEAQIGEGVDTPWTESQPAAERALSREEAGQRAASPDGLAQRAASRDGLAQRAASPDGLAQRAASRDGAQRAPSRDGATEGDAELAAALAQPAAPRRSGRSRGEVSEITHFDQRVGEGSRYAMAAIAVAAVAGLAFIMLFPKAPPEGLAEPAGRTKLPPELVEAALERAEQKGRVDAGAGLVIDGQATGAASITADPPVDIYLGTHKLGRTPTTIVLPAGRHELRLTDAERRINAYREVVIEESELARVDVTFEQFELVLAGPRGADVFLNAQRIDRLPARPLRLYEGEYLLEIRYDGQRWSERIASAPGARVEVAIETTPAGLVRK